MSTTQIIAKIDTLPDVLKTQVVDFVDFLIARHLNEKKSTNDFTLTESGKKELEKRHADYLKNPESGIPLDELKNKLMKKYGL